jgi:acetylornithine/succinyldiaminopimelate/putrescine aminotransferase
MQPGDHASTFAAGPLVCAAALVVFDRLNGPQFLANVRAQAEYLKERLNTLRSDLIVEVRSAGLLVGIEMRTPVAPLIAAAREKGLLVINAGENVLRLAPPLIISPEEIDLAVSILQDVLDTM